MSAEMMWAALAEHEKTLPSPFRVTQDACEAFVAGWESAMKFMAQPRIPAPSTGTPLPIEPTTGYTIPLVAFYTT